MRPACGPTRTTSRRTIWFDTLSANNGPRSGLTPQRKIALQASHAVRRGAKECRSGAFVKRDRGLRQGNESCSVATRTPNGKPLRGRCYSRHGRVWSLALKLREHPRPHDGLAHNLPRRSPSNSIVSSGGSMVVSSGGLADPIIQRGPRATVASKNEGSAQNSIDSAHAGTQGSATGDGHVSNWTRVAQAASDRMPPDLCPVPAWHGLCSGRRAARAQCSRWGRLGRLRTLPARQCRPGAAGRPRWPGRRHPLRVLRRRARLRPGAAGGFDGFLPGRDFKCAMAAGGLALGAPGDGRRRFTTARASGRRVTHVGRTAVELPARIE
jgi:autotransporter passenger strand-loop-strand repeat protein